MSMKAKFYDVKEHKSVDAEVLEAVAYKNNRYAYKAKTADGRNLTRFVNQAEYEKFNGKAAKPACKKGGCKK